MKRKSSILKKGQITIIQLDDSNQWEYADTGMHLDVVDRQKVLIKNIISELKDQRNVASDADKVRKIALAISSVETGLNWLRMLDYKEHYASLDD